MLQAGVKLPLPELYDGKVDLDMFELFISKVLDWLETYNMLQPGTKGEQVLFLGNRLTEEATQWYHHNVQYYN